MREVVTFILFQVPGEVVGRRGWFGERGRGWTLHYYGDVG